MLIYCGKRVSSSITLLSCRLMFIFFFNDNLVIVLLFRLHFNFEFVVSDVVAVKRFEILPFGV